MDYTLAICALSRNADELEELVPATVARLDPQPTQILIFDNGRECEAEQMVRDQRLRAGRASAITIVSSRRCVSDNEARRRLWKAAGAASAPFALVMDDDWRFVRRVDVRDVAYVLEREPDLRQMAFIARDYEPAVFPRQRRGGGAVVWVARTSMAETPALIRTELARSFPWPDDGVDGIEMGIRYSLPGSIFGLWGNGEPWVELT